MLHTTDYSAYEGLVVILLAFAIIVLLLIYFSKKR